MTDKLFTPAKAGNIDLANRIVMAPLTRNRANNDDDTVKDMHADYYAQRASGGLLITEATQISPEGKGYWGTPGIYSDAQVKGWRAVTDAVHKAGGKIVMQLWHVGRISHTSLQPDGQAPVAPSAIAAGTQTFDGKGSVDTSTPRALDLEEMPRLIADYVKAAENAKAAGFDGVEVHAANGYLLDEFLRDTSNKRTDAFGGSIENRTRLLVEVMSAVTKVWGPGRVGIRLSPWSNANNVGIDSDTPALFGHIIDVLNGFDLAYLHMVEGQTGGPRDAAPADDLAALRKAFKGFYIANNGFTRELAVQAVEHGRVDAVAFGVPYIANPDLAERLEQNAELNAPDKATFYGGGREGYTDYPTLAKVAAE